MDIINLYKTILTNIGMVADDEGFISSALGPTKDPVLINEQRLVLPTRNQLETPNLGNRVIFHPLHESLLRGESKVIARAREYANSRVSINLTYISLCLLTLATSPADHARLSPDQTIFLDKIKDIDENILEPYQKLIEVMSVGDPARQFVHMFIKNGGQLGNRTFNRLCVVSFPLYEELIKRPAPGQPNIVFGVRLKKAEREAMINLIEYMVPNIATPHAYSRGSDSTVAPTLDALMQSVGAFGSLITDLVELFGDNVIPQAESMKYPTDWMEVFKDLRAIQKDINMIPAQPGNEGTLPPTTRTVIDVPEGQITITPKAAPAPAKEPPPWEDPAPTPAPAPAADNGSIFIRPAGTVAPAPVQQPKQVVINRPAPAPVAVQPYQQPGYQQPMQVGAPMGMNPGTPYQSHNPYLPNYVPPNQTVGAIPGAPFMTTQQMGGYGYQQPQRQHVPSWDRPAVPGYSMGYGGNNGGGFRNL